MNKFTIADVRTFIIEGVGSGADYSKQQSGHWIIDSLVSNPMSVYPEYKASRADWGIDVHGSVFVEIETVDGAVGYATGFGGKITSWLISRHFKRFLIGSDARDLNKLWDQMFRASMYYGRKGITLAAISVVDLALWDLCGKLRNEPVYKMIGGDTMDEIKFYCTGPVPAEIKKFGFWGGKVPLPHGPADGTEGLRKNVEFLTAHREAVGQDFPLMVDCYMSLNVTYAVELATACEHLDIYWWEEVLHPDDIEGYKMIKAAHPGKKWTTGEHEYTRYGFRQLINSRYIDILQPDVTWVGGLTELLKISAIAAAYDIPVVPHGSGPYSYHFVKSQTNSPYCEYIANSPDGKEIRPVFGDLFINEPVPTSGKVALEETPGFGLIRNETVKLISCDPR